METGCLWYRYRTAVLVGPWRDSARDAIDDACRVGQMHQMAATGEVTWKVEGSIEQAWSTGRPPGVDPPFLGAARLLEQSHRDDAVGGSARAARRSS